MQRRIFLSSATTVLGAAALTRAAGAPDVKEETAALSHAPLVQVSTPRNAVVDTVHGRVRGYVRNGIYTFKGMRYGASTAGANRFLPPAQPSPWAGLYEAFGYGAVCPQGANLQWPQPQWAYIHQWDNGITGEDCLRINVWTPGINDAAKRPVMVWLHGGDWIGGSSQELPAYDGENLSRRGDVVMVSVNHRLNLFGFTNLAEMGGEKYVDSGNAGLLDLIAALKWVRANIVGFGGNPDNVTIFGQSGGGSKVCHLMAAPAAKGLLHKAIVQSGRGIRSGNAKDSLKMASMLLAELGLTRSTLDRIHALPYQRLQEAHETVTMKLSAARGTAGGAIIRPSPIMDGRILPAHPFDPVATPLAADIPLLVGNNAHEVVNLAMVDPRNEDMTDAQLRELLREAVGPRIDEVIAAFHRAHPVAKPVDLHARIHSWNGGTAASTLQLARLKSTQPAAVYRYLFTWSTPVLDGRPRAYHGAELPHMFDNIDRCANSTGGGAQARALAAKMSQAWLNFARSGNPNHAGLPHWPTFGPERLDTMVFDDTCKVIADPDGEGRRLLAAG